MKTNHISNGRKVGGNYFYLVYDRRVSNTPLKYYLDKFNHEDYYILKSTKNQRLITYDELLEFKYSGCIFFRKDLYNIESILEWCDLKLFIFINKPTPPFSPSKIIIKQ